MANVISLESYEQSLDEEMAASKIMIAGLETELRIAELELENLKLKERLAEQGKDLDVAVSLLEELDK